jgi:isatin hydrolase
MMTDTALTSLVTGLAAGTIRVVDLTQPLEDSTPVIHLPPDFAKNSPGFKMHSVSNFNEDGPGWYWNWFEMGEHCGTHFDAPNHWHTGRGYSDGGTDTIPVDRFVGPANVIDVSAKAAANSDYLLTVDDVLEFEAKHGKIEEDTWVLMRTDWHKRSGDAFLNGGSCPGPSAEVMQFLASERKIRGFGVEQVGTDAGCAGGLTPPFPAHHIMHEANRYGLASLANLDQLPPKGAVIVAAPLKIVKGSGSPLRVLALVGS